MIELPIVLNRMTVYANARRAYLNGTLQAISPRKQGATGCSYGQNCAIGASMTDEQKRFCDGQAQNNISALLANGIVTSDDPRFLQTLQGLHDNACTYIGRGTYLPLLAKELGIPFDNEGKLA